MRDFTDWKTYSFKFKGDWQERVAGLHSIGKESRTDHSYRWEGLDRIEQGRVVFKFTLNGKGAIRIGTSHYELHQGDAFIVRLPSDHCYYLPEDSSRWEFIFITLFGQEALDFYEKISGNYGQVIKMSEHAEPVKEMHRILENIQTKGIGHGYEASGYAYSFIMTCLQYMEHDRSGEIPLPASVADAISFMEAQFSGDLGLDDIVAVSGLSKYHFTRLFRKTTGETPVQYLTKIRISESVKLLKENELTIEEVARKVGYANGNYYSKVFRKLMDMTPGEYRNSAAFMSVDRLFFD